VDLTDIQTRQADEASRVKLRAVTYNNIGCYYRKMGQPREALVNLERALQTLEETSNPEHAGDTHLNICAILSQMGRHTEALEHAQTALILLQEELYFENNSGESGGAKSRFGVLAIAYHNIAVEQEHLGRFEDCLATYCKALELSQAQLGDSHPITVSLSKSFDDASNTWSNPQCYEKEEGPRAANPRSASRPSSAMSRSSSYSSSTKSHNKYTRTTTKTAVSRLSRGHPSSRTPIRAQSASHAAVKRRESSLMGANVTRTARSLAKRDAEDLYGNERFDLDMLTPRGASAR